MLSSVYPAIDYSQNLSSLSCFLSSVRNPRPYPAFISCALRPCRSRQQLRDKRAVRLLFGKLRIHHDAPPRRSDMLTGSRVLSRFFIDLPIQTDARFCQGGRPSKSIPLWTSFPLFSGNDLPLKMPSVACGPVPSARSAQQQ
jgi:hypothetical protein